MRIETKRLKAFLLDSGLVTEEQFSDAEKKTKKNGQDIEEVLTKEGYITQEELTRLRAYILGVPFVNLEKTVVKPAVLRIIPEPIARSYNIVAFRKNGRELSVAMLDPDDLQTIDFIKKAADLKILPRLTTQESIKNVLGQYTKTLEAEFSDIIKKESGDIKTIKEQGDELIEGNGLEILEKQAEELPIIRVVDALLKHAILQRASDIHIEPTQKEIIIRYRIDGILHEAMVLPKQVSAGIVARIKVLANLRLDEHRLPQDGRFKIEKDEYKYSVRVSVLPVIEGEKIVMRLLAETTKALSLEEVGICGDALEKIEENLKKPVGMILVVGPTGSGKTTTLYSLLDILNTLRVNISTIEDPVEYRIPRANQTQVRADIGLTFASGLRALVRQDPDIIMVGEIRDNETASLAINAALTGHLVFSTLHTTNAAGTIPRMIDMEVEPFLISSTLNIIIAQRLARRLCPNKEEYYLSDSQIKEISKCCNEERVLEILRKRKIIKKGKTLKQVPFFRAQKSKENPEGYKGRVGIFEVLPVTESIKALIVERATSDQIQKQAVREGMVLMIEDGLIKAAQGITSIEEILRIIIE